ncbi:MAG: suppressor of fused domain protein [Brumimicrobium sp.]|nr:suppressor of fused domain protein [Brumimicrobium sp.]MCO5267545.1 suppressor of fused domain protein [Brumimicrobium sp.]
MSELEKALKEKFGEHRVKEFITEDEMYIPLLEITIQTNLTFRVIVTNGMSDYKMPIPNHLKTVNERVYNELFICLPEYWDFTDENRKWPIETLQKLAKNVIEKETWYGPGHTIANGNPTKPISNLMEQEYFLLADPIYLEEFMKPLQLNDKKIYFLAVIPLLMSEYDLLVYKAYPKWLQKFKSGRGNEIIDEYKKTSSLRRRIFNF